MQQNNGSQISISQNAAQTVSDFSRYGVGVFTWLTSSRPMAHAAFPEVVLGESLQQGNLLGSWPPAERIAKEDKAEVGFSARNYNLMLKWGTCVHWYPSTAVTTETLSHRLEAGSLSARCPQVHAFSHGSRRQPFLASSSFWWPQFVDSCSHMAFYSLRLFTSPLLGACLYPNFSFLQGCQSLPWRHFHLIISVKTLFPNKITLGGTGSQNLTVSIQPITMCLTIVVSWHQNNTQVTYLFGSLQSKLIRYRDIMPQAVFVDGKGKGQKIKQFKEYSRLYCQTSKFPLVLSDMVNCFLLCDTLAFSTYFYHQSYYILQQLLTQVNLSKL